MSSHKFMVSAYFSLISALVTSADHTQCNPDPLPMSFKTLEDSETLADLRGLFELNPNDQSIINNRYSIFNANLFH